MTKADIVVSQLVDAPLEALWESWADFGGIYKFHKDVIRTTILTETVPRGMGAARLCELADGRNEIEEQIVEWTHMKKLGVHFKRTSLPISHARADFLFEQCAGASSRVEMRFSFTPRGMLARLMKPLMVRKMRAGFAQLLLSNKRYVEQLKGVQKDA